MSRVGTDGLLDFKEGKVTMESNSWLKLHRRDALELFFWWTAEWRWQERKEGDAEAGNIWSVVSLPIRR